MLAKQWHQLRHMLRSMFWPAKSDGSWTCFFRNLTTDYGSTLVRLITCLSWRNSMCVAQCCKCLQAECKLFKLVLCVLHTARNIMCLESPINCYNIKRQMHQMPPKSFPFPTVRRLRWRRGSKAYGCFCSTVYNMWGVLKIPVGL